MKKKEEEEAERKKEKEEGRGRRKEEGEWGKREEAGKERVLEEIFLNYWTKVEIEKRKFRRMGVFVWERD